MKYGKFCWVFALFLRALTPAYGQGPGPGMGSGGGDGPGSLAGFRGHELEHNLVLPQLATGKDITTTLVLLNVGDPLRLGWLSETDLETRGSVYFFHSDGSPLELMVNGQGPASEFSFSLKASALLTLDLTSSGPNRPGWALIEVEEGAGQPSWGMRDNHDVYRGERLMAHVFYTLSGQPGEILSRVGVFPAVYEREHFFTSLMSVQYGVQTDTGVAVVNTSGQTVSVELRLKKDGQVLAATTLSLAPGNQTARFVSELFAGLVPEGFSGILEVSTTQEGVVAMGLLMAQNTLTSIPTLHFGRWSGGPMMP